MTENDDKDRRKGRIALFGLFGFIGSFAVAGQIQNTIDELINRIVDVPIAIFDALGFLGERIFRAALAPITDFVTTLFQIPVDILQAAADLFLIPIEALTDAIAGLGDTLAGNLSVTGFAAEGNTVLGLPSITWAIFGIILIGSGVVLDRITPDIGPLKSGTAIGSVFVVIGAMVGAWGFYPGQSQYFIAGVFAVLFIYMIWIYTGEFRREFST